MPDNVRPTVKVSNLRTGFSTPAGTVVAVDDVSFELNRNEILSIIGESGSGKTVTALSLIKLIATPPGKYLGGTIKVEGSDILKLSDKQMEEVRGKTIGMIFQNPRASLDPSFTTEFQLIETLTRHDPTLTREAARNLAINALREVGFPDAERVLASYPHQLSGGMCQRVGLAMVLACEPSLLIADEPTTALDVGVQAKILLLLKKRNRETGLPIIIITHDIGVVAAVSTRVLVMYGGHVQEEGSVDDVLENALHPYTQALIRSIPDPDQPNGEMTYIEGEPPNLFSPPPGCRFAPRCEHAIDICREALPELQDAGNGRKVRCHLVETGPTQ